MEAFSLWRRLFYVFYTACLAVYIVLTVQLGLGSTHETYAPLRFIEQAFTPFTVLTTLLSSWFGMIAITALVLLCLACILLLDDVWWVNAAASGIGLVLHAAETYGRFMHSGEVLYTITAAIMSVSLLFIFLGSLSHRE
jgi:hypothetical protein